MEHAACPGAGSCAGHYTANTMAAAIEAIGLALPGTASIPAVDERRHEASFRSGEAVLNLLEKNIRPRDILTRKGDHDEAVAVFQRAARANPLERRPQQKLETAYMYRARAHAEAGRFDDARADYQTALGLAREHKYPALCKWAACEFKAGDARRGEELLQQALGESGSGLAVTYSMLIETIRLSCRRR